ncbi:MAG: RNA polymerase sigma factor [Pirellulales bacterium]
MTDADAFQELIGRVRAGDEHAAAELVRRYEPLVRREVRLQLEDTRLRRIFDSMDVVQSVLASFFIRAAAGEYDLDSPEQLARLLVQMARNKLASAARRQYRQRRDMRRTQLDHDVLQTLATTEQAPSDVYANQEILEAMRQQLTSEELRIADLRADGRSWDEVALALGGKPQARRMQLMRGIERAVKKLGLARLYE